MKTVLPLVALLCACAATNEQLAAPTRLASAPAETGKERPPAPPMAQFDGRAFAAAQATPRECERAARDLAKVDRWSGLRACIERVRYPRGPFTDLQILTNGNWDDELQSRKDAPELAARLVAARGGDVDGDLPALQKSRLPVFSLAAALRQPAVYKGRWLVLRGRLGELQTDGAQSAALLSETTLHNNVYDQQVGSSSHHESSSSGHIDARTSQFGSGSASWSDASKSKSYSSKQHYENEVASTGRQALGRIAKPDPFLTPDKEMVFLARFDGVRTDDNNETVALVTIQSYFPPSPLVVE